MSAESDRGQVKNPDYISDQRKKELCFTAAIQLLQRHLKNYISSMLFYVRLPRNRKEVSIPQ